MFKEDLKLYSSLSHPCIVQYYGCHVERGLRVFFLESGELGNLESCLQDASHSLTLTNGLLSIAKNILTGLAYLHSLEDYSGLAHGEIQSQNVQVRTNLTAMLTGIKHRQSHDQAKGEKEQQKADEEKNDGQQGRRRSHRSSGLRSATGSYSMATTYYVAPEQYFGERSTEKTDLFGFGFLLFEMTCFYYHRAFMTNLNLVGEVASYRPIKVVLSCGLKKVLDARTAREKINSGWRPMAPMLLLESWPRVVNLINRCWHTNPEKRVRFSWEREGEGQVLS